MKARNKHTGVECEIFWDMCDTGRRCEASDKPIQTGIPCCDYNAVVDDYEVFVNGKWVEGLEFIKDPYSYYKKKKDLLEFIDSIPKEPVSDGLEEAAKEYSAEQSVQTGIQSAFIAGANWQKQQMMNMAIEGRIVESSNMVSKQEDFWRIISIVYNQQDMNPYLQAGDNIKIIFIKKS